MTSVLIRAALFIALLPAQAFAIGSANPCSADVSGKVASAECKLVLTPDGYIKDSQNGKQLFAEPLENSTMVSSALYRVDDSYVIESTSSSSSRNVDWIFFNYDGKSVAAATKVMSLERNVLPDRSQWVGWECRSKQPKPLNPQMSAMAGAVNGLCGENADKLKNSSSDPVFNSNTDFVRKIDGLKVDVNVFGGSNVGSALYLFYFSDTPDFRKMLCFSGCEIRDREDIRFTGRIGPAAWISMKLALNPSGTNGYYYYNKYRKKIALTGVFDPQQSLSLDERGGENGAISASFKGSGSADAQHGQWESKAGTRLPFFLLRDGF
jgi:hypothetical protein